MTFVWIDEQVAFEQVVDEAAKESRYCLDTEFHRERTYYPRLALVQIAWSGGIALIDPLAVDIVPLKRLLQSDALAVVHAAQQDLDVLQHACGAVPSRLYDTQIAASFLGYSTPSLASLLSAELRVQVAKGDRLTDWLRRPLTADQRTYAASDVEYLAALHDGLTAQLTKIGRETWAEEVCEELRTKPTGPSDPESAWLRLKDTKILKGKARGVARSVAAWRERRAMASDIPTRQVLPDLALLGISQRAPKTLNELVGCRGVDERHSRGRLAEEILAAVAAGRDDEPPVPEQDGEELARHLRPAVTLISAWVSELSRQRRIDTMLLATRSDFVALLRGDTDARLLHGWRAGLLGDDLHHLIEGKAALSFDGKGGLRLIRLSGADVIAEAGSLVDAPAVPVP